MHTVLPSRSTFVGAIASHRGVQHGVRAHAASGQRRSRCDDQRAVCSAHHEFLQFPFTFTSPISLSLRPWVVWRVREPGGPVALALDVSNDNKALMGLLPALRSLDVHGSHAITCLLRVLLHHTLGISLLEASDDDGGSDAQPPPPPLPTAVSSSLGRVQSMQLPSSSSSASASASASSSVPPHTVGTTRPYAMFRPRAPKAGDADGCGALLGACTTLLGSLVENILEVLAALQLAGEGEVEEVWTPALQQWMSCHGRGSRGVAAVMGALPWLQAVEDAASFERSSVARMFLRPRIEAVLSLVSGSCASAARALLAQAFAGDATPLCRRWEREGGLCMVVWVSPGCQMESCTQPVSADV